jgi:hypothetical protein
MWPTLCLLVVNYISTEVKASVGKKKGPEANLSKIFKMLIQRAEDERRSGVCTDS